MDLGISGRHALVFGGSRGLGLASATQLAKEGVRVVIAARDPSTLRTAAEQITREAGTAAGWVSADITTEAGRDAALAACPRPDILINNADGMPPGDFRDWRPETWHLALDAMMIGPIEMIRRTVDGMMDRRFGRIINIVSRSVKQAQVELGLSNGARSGLVGFVAGLSRQTVRHNVTINNLLPGVFATDAQRNHILGMLESTGKTFDQLWLERGNNNPAGRFGQAHEFGAYCAFLCSAQAAYVNGQNLMIDAGAYPGTF
jgi:3-oxoacyl-[acyl-carrier protein] reductase